MTFRFFKEKNIMYKQQENYIQITRSHKESELGLPNLHA